MKIDARIPANSSPDVSVWDRFVRRAHWIRALSFALAYLTEDDWLTTHVWAGYVARGMDLLRIVWGFIGTELPSWSGQIVTRCGDFRYRSVSQVVDGTVSFEHMRMAFATSRKRPDICS